MSPCFALNDVADGGLPHSEFGRQLRDAGSAGVVAGSNRRDLSVGEKRSRMACAVEDGASVPAPSHHVVNVLDGFPIEEMGGIAARRVIALVTNEMAQRNRAFGDFEGNSMRISQLPINPGLPIAAWQAASCPGPAGIRAARAVNLSPELLDARLRVHREPPTRGVIGPDVRASRPFPIVPEDIT